jgi:P pilus assembly chaperone PapD
MKMTARILTSLLLLFITVPALAGVGDLTVSPTRIIFEGHKRTAQVTLINRGSKTATYRVGFTQMRMKENGELVEIQKPNEREKFLDSLVRFAPRQVTLKPGIGQTVRLLVRKPSDLPRGEYRSHLLFYAIPDENAGTNVETLNAKTKKGLQIALRPIFRFSIPVILRQGDLKADFTITDFRLTKEKKPSVNLTVDRDGNRSVYGDLDIQYFANAAAQPVLLQHMKDFVLYTSNNRRTISLPLSVPDGVSLDRGILKATYYKKTKDGKRILAEKQIVPE